MGHSLVVGARLMILFVSLGKEKSLREIIQEGMVFRALSCQYSRT